MASGSGWRQKEDHCYTNRSPLPIQRLVHGSDAAMRGGKEQHICRANHACCERECIIEFAEHQQSVRSPSDSLMYSSRCCCSCSSALHSQLGSSDVPVRSRNKAPAMSVFIGRPHPPAVQAWVGDRGSGADCLLMRTRRGASTGVSRQSASSVFRCRALRVGKPFLELFRCLLLVGRRVA